MRNFAYLLFILLPWLGAGDGFPAGAAGATTDLRYGPMDYPDQDRLHFEDDPTLIPNLTSEVDLIVFLKHPNPEAIYGTLRTISDPHSPYYGQYLSQSEVASLVGRDDRELDLIKNFFQANLPSSVHSHFSETKDHLFMRSSVRDLQSLFESKLGYSGVYDEVHRGSNVLIGHRTLAGDAAQDDLLAVLPEHIRELIDNIQMYLPEHVYISNDDLTYFELLDSKVCSFFDFFVRDDAFPIGSWTSSVRDYASMNPFRAEVKTDNTLNLYVLKGTRGVKDRGILHFIPTQIDGSIRIWPHSEGAALCDLSQDDLWDRYLLQDTEHIQQVDLMVVQDDVPELMSYPFTKDFIHADCHSRCEINGVDGTCVMYQVKFNIKPFRQTKVHARLVMSDRTVTPWIVGEGNKQAFASNTVVDMVTIQKLYNMEAFKRTPNRDMIIVTSFLEEQFDPEDTMQFMRDQGIPIDNMKERLFIVGPNNPNEGRMTGIEASLDVEIIMALSPDYNVVYWNVPGRELTNNSEPFLRLMYQISTWNVNKHRLPSILSISYGDEEMNGLGRHLARLDREMAKLGMMGVTVVAASGDDGANGMKSRDKNDPNRCLFASPGFPASLPSVTAVGATQMSNLATPMCHRGRVTLPPMGNIDCESEGEIVAETDMGGSLITSGGGYSYYFDSDMDMLWYQRETLRKYEQALSLHGIEGPPASFYNKTGRGFPDIAVMGTNVPVVLGRKWAFLSGTSVSAPVASALIANLRTSLKERLGANQLSLGFINPLLYALASTYPDVFNDVVVGKNNCGYRGMDCCENGFDAVTGWDPVSGLGSLNVTNMATRIIDLLKETQYPYSTDVVIQPSVNPMILQE